MDRLVPEAEESRDSRIFSSFIDKVGSMGCYQRMLVVVLSIVQYLCGGLFLVAPFLFYQDPYQCTSSPDGMSCHQYVCSLNPQDRMAFIPETSLRSIPNNFGDFRCSVEKLGLTAAISLMLFGMAGGALFLALIGDRLSRKLLMILSQFAVAIGLVIALCCTSLENIGLGLFITMAGVQNCFFLSFAIITEEISESHRSTFTVLIQMMFGLGMLMNVLWAYCLQDWKTLLFSCYFIPMLVMIIAVHVFVVDTPMDLATRNCASSALMAFEHQARLNGTYENSTITLMQIHELKDKYTEKMEKY
jgi:hypothetical protein